MHKAKESQIRSNLEEERHAYLKEQRWTIEKKDNSTAQSEKEQSKFKVQYESSFMRISSDTASSESSMVMGRRSFNRFNKEVEVKVKIGTFFNH